MTDTNTAPAVAAALPEGPVIDPFSPQENTTVADANADSQATLEARKDAALAKLDEVKAELEAAYQRATQEAGWVHAVETFIEDIEVKADGIVAWIKRHI